MGEIAGSLPGTLQYSVLGALTSLLQLCIRSPKLVPQLEVLAEILPRGMLAGLLTGSGRTAAPTPKSTSPAAFGAAETSPADLSPLLHSPDPVDRPAELSGEERCPCSVLTWLLAPGSRGSLVLVQGFIEELLHTMSFITGYMMNPGRTLYRICKTFLKQSRPTLVVGARLPFTYATRHCAPLQAAECAGRSDHTSARSSMNCTSFIEHLELDRLDACRQLLWLKLCRADSLSSKLVCQASNDCGQQVLAAVWSEVYVMAEQDASKRDNVFRLLQLRDARVTASRLLLAATFAIGEGRCWLQHPLRAEVTP